MNKLSYWLIVPLLAFSVLTGVERESGGEATIQKQESTSLSATIDHSPPDASAEQQPRRSLALKKVVRSLAKSAMQQPAAKQVTRPQMLVRQAQNARQETTARRIRPFGARSAPREHRLTVQPKFASGAGLGTDALSTIAEFTNTAGATISEYTIGDTIILTITSTDTVYMELYVDDGDTLFDEFNDLWFDAEDKGQGYITIIDGDNDDEDPTAGVWQLTLDTGDLGEGGEFFALQGVRLWFNFWTPAGPE